MGQVAIRILHTNDMHGTLDDAIQSKLTGLRSEADVYFDSGDCIKTGNLGIPLREEPVWGRLDALRCDASVLGNRESHVLSSAFEKKLSGSKHPLLASNMHRRDGSSPLHEPLVLAVGGLRVGVFGVMVPMVTSQMKTQAASAYLWDQPIATALKVAKELRRNVDLLIALTHIGHRQDRDLAEKCPSIDVILGGHSHTVLEQPERIGNTFVCQGGSHNRFAGVYQWANGSLTGHLVALK